MRCLKKRAEGNMLLHERNIISMSEMWVCAHSAKRAASDRNFCHTCLSAKDEIGSILFLNL